MSELHLKAIDHNPQTAGQIAGFEAQTAGNVPYARVLVVRADGTSFCRPGDHSIVTSNGELFGLAASGCIRSAIKNAGLEVLQTGETKLVRAVPRRVFAETSDDHAELVANECPSEGDIEFFVEPVFPKPCVLVYGETMVSSAIVELARFSGFNPIRTDHKTNPSALPSSAFCVVATLGMHDRLALQAALSSDSDIILFIASRKKIAKLKDSLFDIIPPERLACLISPAGLDIGAVGPAEIAVSVIAQLIQFRRVPEAMK